MPSRRAFTVKEKAEIITKLKKGENNADLCKEYKVPHSTISTIWKNRDEILECFESKSLKIKRNRKPMHQDVENALLAWFKAQRSQNIPLSGRMLQEKANHFARCFGKSDFECSESWIYRFRQRHDIIVGKVCEEAASISESVCDHRLKTVFSKLTEDSQIWNADETETDMDKDMVTASPGTPERRIFTHSEKVSLQTLIYKYRLNCTSGHKTKDTCLKKNAWDRITQEFNSIDTNSCRTTAQLKKCWDNIKTRRKQALRSRITSEPVHERYPLTATPELSEEVDPLVSVKNEHQDNNERLLWAEDEVDNQLSNEFVAAETEASMEGPSSPQQPVPRVPVNGTSQPHTEPKTDCRSEQREEELHKLKIAEKMLLLKTLKEQHRKAQLDREKAQLEREKAQIERDKAQFERDKAKLELNRAMRQEELHLELEKSQIEGDKAQFERDKAQFERDKAKLELNRAMRKEEIHLEREKSQIQGDKAQFERDKAQFERDKAKLELNRAMREEELHLDREKSQIEGDKAQFERDKAQFERDKAKLELNRAMREEELHLEREKSQIEGDKAQFERDKAQLELNTAMRDEELHNR